MPPLYDACAHGGRNGRRHGGLGTRWSFCSAVAPHWNGGVDGFLNQVYDIEVDRTMTALCHPVDVRAASSRDAIGLAKQTTWCGLPE